MNILIIGGAGYIGGVTAHLATQQGHTVTVFDDLSSGKEANVPKGAAFIQGDVTKKADIEKAFHEGTFDFVMHFAAKILVSESMVQPYNYIQTNTFGVLNAVDAAVTNGNVKGYILSSTAATYGVPETFPIEESSPKQPINPYGVSKLMAEQILSSYHNTHNLSWAALRYFNVAGAFDGVGPDYPFISHIIPMLLDRLDNHQPISIFGDDYATPDGTCVRDYVHVYDIARAHLLAAEKIAEDTEINQAINLGSNSGYSVKEVVERFQAVTGESLDVTYEARRPGDPDQLVASNALANQLLDWKPTKGLDEIIHDHYEWHVARKNKGR